MANGSRQAAWEFFGTELKRRREDAGITQVELGARVFVSGGYIGQFEQAIRKPQLDVAQRIDEALQTDGIFERLCRKLIDDPRYADYFAGVVELERLASTVCDFEPTVVPGLLQTPGYARALTLATHPFAAEEFVGDRVAARMERSRILGDATRPVYWAVVHETVLHVPVGGPEVTAAALEHMSALAAERKVLLQVLPFLGGRPCQQRVPQAHGVRGRSANRLYRDVVFRKPAGRSGGGAPCPPSLRSDQGRRTVAGGVPRPGPIGG